MYQKPCVGTTLKVQAATILLAIMLAFWLSATSADGPARDENIRLMLAYPLSLINEPEMFGNCVDGETSYRLSDIAPDGYVSSVRLSRVSERASAYTASVKLPNEPKRNYRSIAAAEWATFEALIVKTEFWELQTEVNVWKLEARHRNFYLEGCRTGLYHVIRRDTTNYVDLKELVLFFASISRSMN